MFPVFTDNISGTRYITTHYDIPAGTYTLRIDSISSTDTDSGTCGINLGGGSGLLQYSRNTQIDAEITLSSDSNTQYWYASNSSQESTGDTVTFNGVVLSKSITVKADLGGISELLIDKEYDSPITVEAGAISSDGHNDNRETYLPIRRRTPRYSPYLSGGILMCDDAYSMCVFFYSQSNTSSYISSTGYIGSKYRLDEIENANYLRVSFKKKDNTAFNETEIPDLYYFVESDKVSTALSRADAVYTKKECKNQFVNGGIARTGTAVSASTGIYYLISTMPVDSGVALISAKDGYKVTLMRYDAQGTWSGFLTDKNTFTTDSNKGIYWCSEIDMSELRELYPTSTYKVEITNSATKAGTNTQITPMEESNVIYVYSDVYAIQPYYVDEMEETIASVRDALTEPALVFPLVTDIHYLSRNNAFDSFIKNLMVFCKNVKCDYIANLGDNTDGNTTQDVTLERNYHMLSAFNEIDAPYYHAIGNHDTNYYNTNAQYLFTSDEIYKSYLSNTHGVCFDMTSGEKNYYKDFDELGIRVVVLDASHNRQYAYSERTSTWLSEVALDTDKIVVLLEHLSSINTQNWNAQALLYDSAVTSVLTAFVNNGGTLIQFCGHSHADYHFITPWLTIFSCCQKTLHEDTSSGNFTKITGYEGSIVSPERTLGTVSEDCWTVVIIKPLSRTVECIRFGAGSDRSFTY